MWDGLQIWICTWSSSLNSVGHRQNWDNETLPVPEAWNLYFDELTLEQQIAMINICFIPPLWDEELLGRWVSDDVYQVLFEHEPPAIVAEDTIDGRTDGQPETVFIPPLSSLISTQVDEIPFPKDRFALWDTLLEADSLTQTRSGATTLNYTQETWETPGTARVEGFSYGGICHYYEGLPVGTLVCPTQVSLVNMGFTEDVWDCWQNHYEWYDWDELEQYNLVEHYVTLGYNATSWYLSEDEFLPDSFQKTFDQLTSREQQAAVSLCYLPPLWDGQPIPEWIYLAEYQFARKQFFGPPTSSPTSKAPSSFSENILGDSDNAETVGDSAKDDFDIADDDEAGFTGTNFAILLASAIVISIMIWDGSHLLGFVHKRIPAIPASAFGEPTKQSPRRYRLNIFR